MGITDQTQLEQLIESNRDDGITLTTLGFGQGNLNDAMMESIADKGNGQYIYIDGIKAGNAPSYSVAEGERAGVERALGLADPGDVIATMAHEESLEIHEYLRSIGARPR